MRDYQDIKECIICGAGAERCHIKSRGSGGGDEDWNILWMCRRHHQEQHRTGFVEMCKRYSIVTWNLAKKGWEFTRWGKLVRKA